MSPFFIVGCGRSGTTLLRTMLSQHPQVAIPLESLFIIDYLRARPKPAFSLQKLMACEYELVEWGLEVVPDDLKGCVTAKELVDRVHELYMRKHGKTIWGQKTPRFVRYGELLKANYPQAKFIHLIRDPRAVVSSLIRSNVHQSNAYFAARRWLKDVKAGLALKEEYPADVLEVRYEDLVSKPEGILQQVCAFLGLSFDPAMLEYQDAGATEYGGYYEKVHSNLKERPNANRIEAWRKHLLPREIALVESLCGETMRALGYPLDFEAPRVKPVYVMYLKLERLGGGLRQAVHYLTKRPRYLTCNLRRKIRLSLLFRGLSDVNY
jgi:hypothetical protein